MKKINVEQIKAARMLLSWDQVTLAKKASIGIVTVKRIEATFGQVVATNRIITKIIEALEGAGIEFVGTPDDGPGVRLYRK
jgi:predicted transcriptional regulator